MNWLTPIGFLGLIGLIVLIIIYIIKPNYQNKIISSTYVWKLSLKYKKNKIPLNKLRNIIIFICQVFVITTAALVLAQPFLNVDNKELDQKVIIIDASASMTAKIGDSTRFEVAVDEALKEVDSIFDKNANGEVSVIVAGEKASFVVQNAKADKRTQVRETLMSLVDPAYESPCTYGSPDIEGAIKYAEEITSVYANSEVILFTDTQYVDPGRVVVRSVRDVNDWNAAVLDVRAIEVENSLRFEIDVACFGKNSNLRVYCDIDGVNGKDEQLNLVADVLCDNDEVQTIIFGKIPEDDTSIEITEEISVFEFSKLNVRIEGSDSLSDDNSFYLYGGKKQPLKIQYCSAAPNNYFATAMVVLHDQLKYRWDVTFVELDKGDTPATEGYDLYIYEHKMPSSLPRDGAVLLVNPDKVPAGAGFRLSTSYRGFAEETPLSAGEAHRVTDKLTAENITVTRYTPLTSYDGYTPVLYCENNPVMIVKNDPDSKIAVMSFSLNFSNLPVILEFPLMFYNLIEYFIPSTVTQYVFDAGDTVTLGSRSESLDVVGPGLSATVTEFPAEITLKSPGVYTVIQTPISGIELMDNFFVKLPAAESNINSSADTLANPVFAPEKEQANMDLLLYLAIALVVLLFFEWWLHTREQY